MQILSLVHFDKCNIFRRVARNCRKRERKKDKERLREKSKIWMRWVILRVTFAQSTHKREREREARRCCNFYRALSKMHRVFHGVCSAAAAIALRPCQRRTHAAIRRTACVLTGDCLSRDTLGYRCIGSDDVPRATVMSTFPNTP